jgi:hypothetical protein
MLLNPTDPNGQPWAPASAQETALHALGASIVAFHEDGTVEVEPEISLSGYAAALITAAGARNAVQLGQQLTSLQQAGCQIVSTGTPAISGTYGILPQDEINIISLQTGITAGAPWLGGYRDRAGIKHVMTAPQFTALATAILSYVEALDEALAASLAGAAWNPPAQPVTIA